MGIYETFDPCREAAFNPEDAFDRIEGFPEIVIGTFSTEVIDALKRNHETRIAGSMGDLRTRHVYEIDVKGRKIGVYKTAMGASMAVSYMEEARVMGAKKFIYFGSCGTLDRELEPGVIIVPTEACRDEGTSYHYMAADAGDYVKVKTADRTAEILEKAGYKVVKTKTWTTDGLYRETRRNMERRLSEGCRIVEMECSAFMAAAEFRDVECYQFVYTEDNLDAIKWEPRTLGKVPESSWELYLEAAIEIALNI